MGWVTSYKISLETQKFYRNQKRSCQLRNSKKMPFLADFLASQISLPFSANFTVILYSNRKSAWQLPFPCQFPQIFGVANQFSFNFSQLFCQNFPANFQFFFTELPIRRPALPTSNLAHFLLPPTKHSTSQQRADRSGWGELLGNNFPWQP